MEMIKRCCTDMDFYIEETPDEFGTCYDITCSHCGKHRIGGYYIYDDAHDKLLEIEQIIKNKLI